MLLGASLAVGATSPADVARDAVVEVRAYAPTGIVMLGSAVAVGPQRLATNCHVIRGATRIEIVDGTRALPAVVSSGDAVRDVCFLESAAMTRMAAVALNTVHVGQKVVAAGFPAGKPLTLSEGQVVALHQYDGACVIQVSAPFDHGSSGGALLDEHGRLLGLLTFKAMAGGAFHFVVPAEWLSKPPSPTKTSGLPFWQRRADDLPFFLRAASMEAAGNWSGLMSVANAWKDREPVNPEAWRAFDKAQAQLVPTSATEDLAANRSQH